MRTTLHLDHIPPAAYRLSSMASKEMAIALQSSPGSSSPQQIVGHQFLLVALPFGRIAIAAPLQAAFVKASWILAERGYRARADQAPGPGKDALAMSIKSLSASGYDLLFARKVACSVELQASFLPAGGSAPRDASAAGESGAFRRYAFQDELEYHCEKALELALRRLFDYLQL